MHAFVSGSVLRWNLTGIRIAGTGAASSGSNRLSLPRCLHIDANDTLYICDYNNNRIQKWILGASNGSTVAGYGNGSAGNDSMGLRNPMSIAFDKNNYMYVADYSNNRIQRFAPNSLIGTTVAGTGESGNETHKVDLPVGVAVDDDLNLYILENGNRRLTRWHANAPNGTVLINGDPGGAAYGQMGFPYGMVLPNSTGNQVYISDATRDRVNLWTFGAALPNKIYSSASGLNLNTPRQIMLDPYGYIYAADSVRTRVVIFCTNLTTGFAVVGSGTLSTPTLNAPSGIAFDSNYNLYVANTNTHEVLKYTRI